jgi:hypothetical protein
VAVSAVRACTRGELPIAIGGSACSLALAQELGASLTACALLAGAYLAWAPPSTDLAAQAFRADLFAEHSFTVANMHYRITREGSCFEYRMTIRTTNRDNASHLAASLRKLELVREFHISPMGD